MGSKVLPQALYMIPRNPNCCLLKKLGFSTVICRRPSSCSPIRVSNSGTSSYTLGLNLNPAAATSAKRSFVVRAESNSEGEPEVTENVEEEEGAEEVAVEESELVSEIESEEAKPKASRKPRIKLGDIMGILNKRAIEASEKERPVPDLRTGDIVEIKLEVPENRRRASIYKGIVISKQNAGIHTTIRIRRIIAGIGVEIVFPVYSPNIKEIKVVKHRKVRRARLYYLRDKLPRLSTFK
ncbi:hypothetical protein L1049_022065 [Liquidambar formosana]|uniref:50S ribosomal protein L19, chloroplastic n=1 Tax=Liquidambar formosana TaxID=63359 RepID=A0AAP0RDW0_LIQFO